MAATDIVPVEPRTNGTITPSKVRVPGRKKNTSKGSVSIVRRIKPACNICNKKFKTRSGVALHKTKMHIARESIDEGTPTPRRTSALMRLDKLANKWLKKASITKDPKAVEAIFGCIMDLKAEFNRK
jgi:hypothetical protein